MGSALHVLHVAAECAPLAKVGGLADVVGALPVASARLPGASASVLLPRYGHLPRAAQRVREGVVRVGGRELAWSTGRAETGLPGVPVYVVEQEVFAEGGVYGGPALERQAVLGAAAADLARAARQGAAPGVDPVDVVHVHDHHPALAALALRHGPGGRVPLVVTVHNARYHGDHDWAAVAGLVPEGVARGDCDHDQRFNSLKAAVLAADAVTTVSPTHARELVERPAASHGLDYAFRAVGERLSGILNGIDVVTWDPATDPALPAPFTAADLAGKARCKAELCRLHGLDPARPLLAFVGRLVPEKGVEALLVLGTGEPRYQDALLALAGAQPARVAAAVRHDEALAHLVYAGADVLLMPSWHEPCGLAQMYALRYGTVPLVHPTGGLRDSVAPFDEAAGVGTGFWMEDTDAPALAAAAARALDVLRRPASWRALQLNGMRADFSWAASAARYLELHDAVRRSLP